MIPFNTIMFDMLLQCSHLTIDFILSVTKMHFDCPVWHTNHNKINHSGSVVGSLSTLNCGCSGFVNVELYYCTVCKKSFGLWHMTSTNKIPKDCLEIFCILFDVKLSSANWDKKDLSKIFSSQSCWDKAKEMRQKL